MTHHVSPHRLASLSAIPKVIILTGDLDHLVDPANSRYLADNIPGSELVEWEKTGHGLVLQWPERFNALLEKATEEGRRRASLAGET